MSFFEVHEGNSGASSFVRRGAGDIHIEVPVMTRDSTLSPIGLVERHGPEDLFALKALP